MRKITYQKIISGILLSLFFIFSFQSQAVSLSTYRIYLGPDSRTASFIMYNKTADAEKCSLSLAHNNFDKNGKMTIIDNSIVPANSAKPWIRYSPKNFTVAGLEPQSVRFVLRRKANSEPNEYRSYLRIDCNKVEQKIKSSIGNGENANLTIRPKLVQQIPIIARTGKLEAKVSFGHLVLSGTTLKFDLQREGTRSIYGKIELINNKTGKMITFKKNVSVYLETDKVRMKFNTQGIDSKNLSLRYTENKTYGGSLVYEQAVIL